MWGDFQREIEAKPTGETAVTYFIVNGIEQLQANAKRREKKQYPETTIIYECLDIITITN